MSETTLPPEGQAEDSQRNLTPPGALLTVGTIQGDGGVLLPPPPLRSERPLPRIDGYEVLEEVGQGGMGVVYKALHLRLKRVVALKMLQPAAGLSTSDWDHLLKRFRREAEALARVRHPNVVEVYDVGETPAGVPYFSLEFCSGGSLDRKLDGTPMPPREAAALIQALARGMAAAHKEQVIHRDLKPANVLLAVGNALRGVPEGSGTPRRAFPTDVVPKITDFGLARKLDEVGQTHSGAIFGTPSYMAPEQAQGKGRLAGPACDIYSLGAILYECLTGKPPFKAATVLDTLQQVISDEPVAPRQFNAKVPRDLETICLGCLHKEPARRYCDADTLADDLGRFLQGESILARPVGLAERTVRWVRKRPGYWRFSCC
jgi:serine/threonine protein kinase